MEPPSKRLRLDRSPYNDDDDDEENQDELSMTPAQFNASQDPMYQLDKKRAQAATRLKSTFEDIFEKYGKDFDGDDDVINFYTDEIEVDNGHVQSLKSRDDAAAENPLSSDEEERIVSGKSGGRGKGHKSQSKSLIPASRPKHELNSRLQFTSPWDKAPGLGAPRLSSLAFSPFPYNAHPLFDFGLSPVGNAPIDPVWQAPDLPIQPYRQHVSIIGAAGSQFDPFYTSPHHSAKRLVSAKSFLMRTTSTSSKGNHDNEEEEDDILLGGSKHDKLPVPRSRIPEKTRIPVTSNATSNQSTQSPSHQPPFHGIDLAKGDVRNQPDGLLEKSIQDRTMESVTTETFSTSHQTAGSPRSTSPSRPKRGRPRKLDNHKSPESHNEEPNPETRPLQPHERRIEILIPMTKRLFPAEMEPEQVVEETFPVVDESPQELHKEQSIFINKSREVTRLQDSLPTTSPIDSHEIIIFHDMSPGSAKESLDASVEHPVQMSGSPKNAPGPLSLQNSQRGRLKRTREQTELTITHMLPHDKRGLESIVIEASQEPTSSQTAVDESTDESVTNGLRKIEQELEYNGEGHRITLDQQCSPVADVDMDEEHAVRNMSPGQSVKIPLIEKQNPEVSSHQSLSPTETLHEDATNNTIEKSNPAAMAAVVSETVTSQELNSSHYENEDLPRYKPDLASVDSHGGETLPIYVHSPDNEAPRHNQQSNEVLDISEILTSHGTRISTSKRDFGSRSPQHPAIYETTESDPHPGEDCLPPIFKSTGIREDQEHDTPNQPVFSSVLIAEIDNLQLGSDPRDAERSPSPQATELPDQDLSAFPAEYDVYSASELVLQPSSRETQIDTEHNIGTGRSPSPELGTPVGHKQISEAASRTNDFPTPTTPTRRRGRPRGAKPRSGHRRSPSSKRFTLSSLIPGGIDDESDDELSIAGSFSSTVSVFHSPFSRASTNDNIDLPPLFSTPRKTTRKHGLLMGSPSSARTPNRVLRLERGGNMPPATDLRTGRSQTQRGRNRTVHSSPLARTVAERLLSSPTKRHRATPQRPPSLVASPHGTLRRCGEDGFVCQRDFCFTCCK
ncbi:hypothetical protein F4859DRAFT_79993 [Xylaria cf. heliscus]|nr:hypothetical protein F4859DRAFT_79993 [Xylaria cf. heliscus]